MKATDRLVVPADVLFVQPGSLAPDLAQRLGAAPDEIVVTRPRSRARSMLIDAAAAALLEQFREPSTVVEAVVRHSALTGEAPDEILSAAVPLLARLNHHRFVAIHGEVDAAAVEPSFAVGTDIVGYELLRCVHLFEDVEVYQARQGAQFVALKILRGEASPESREMLDREASILVRLAGSVAPRLFAQGTLGSLPYLVQDWCEGVSATRAAAQHRRATLPSVALIELCRAVISAYVRLHDSGVVHGDVHPGNARVSSDGRVSLLDFGLSVSDAAAHLAGPRRGGLADYFEPEYCDALLRGIEPPPATVLSDQYGLAALLYQMLTGTLRQDLSLDRHLWLKQVTEGDVIAFEARGMQAWPALERILRRAMAPNPGERFPDSGHLLQAFDAATALKPRRKSHVAPDFIAAVVDRLAPRGLPAKDAIDRIRAPRCSVNYGGAGVAWFFYRLACLRGDARLLAAADVWTARSRAHARDADAFASAEIGITNETVGSMSPFHYVSGLHLVDALVASASGDVGRANRSAADFVATTSNLGPNPDLTLGWSSVILGSASLLEALPPGLGVDRSPLLAQGQAAHAAVLAWLESHSPGDRDLPWFGIAHGWAGLLYALLRWSIATGEPPPERAASWFDALASEGRTHGDQVWWPVARTADGRVSRPQTGWCHGSAGYIQLWTLATDVLGRDYVDLAEASARHLAGAAARDGNRNASLCCGYAGQAYGLLALHRRTGDASLHKLARRFAGLAVEFAGTSTRPDSLYKGDPGIAALLADLDQPQFASTPLFESERWGQSRS